MSVRPRTATRPSTSGIRSAVVEPMSISKPGTFGDQPAARVASASQLAAAARAGASRISSTAWNRPSIPQTTIGALRQGRSSRVEHRTDADRLGRVAVAKLGGHGQGHAVGRRQGARRASRAPEAARRAASRARTAGRGPGPRSGRPSGSRPRRRGPARIEGGTSRIISGSGRIVPSASKVTAGLFAARRRRSGQSVPSSGPSTAASQAPAIVPVGASRDQADIRGRRPRVDLQDRRLASSSRRKLTPTNPRRPRAEGSATTEAMAATTAGGARPPRRGSSPLDRRSARPDRPRSAAGRRPASVDRSSRSTRKLALIGSPGR